MRSTFTLSLLSCALLLATPKLARADDAGIVDAGVVDASATDASATDASATDAALADAGPSDAGLDADAGAAAHIDESAPAAAPVSSPWAVIRTLLGLVALLALAYLGGHPRVQRLAVKRQQRGAGFFRQGFINIGA